MQTNLPDPAAAGNFLSSQNDNQNPVVTKLNDDTGSSPQPSTAVSGSGIHKEVERPNPPETTTYEEISPEIEIAPELEQAGIEVKKETVELPPDMQKMGVQAVGPSQPMGVPTIRLPIDDNKIISGKQGNVLSSLYWLAMWCVRQLKKAHLSIKKIKGQVIRIKD